MLMVICVSYAFTDYPPSSSASTSATIISADMMVRITDTTKGIDTVLNCE